jgi:hypothetical protein
MLLLQVPQKGRLRLRSPLPPMVTEPASSGVVPIKMRRIRVKRVVFRVDFMAYSA